MFARAFRMQKRDVFGRSGLALFVAACCGATAARVAAVPLDQAGEIRLGMRTYAAARVGTEAFDFTDTKNEIGGSFPPSPAGHVRQIRYFLEASLEHDLDRLVRQGVGPLQLFRLLPFRVTGIGYKLTFRGEYEGIYDFGPSEFRTAKANRTLDFPLSGPLPADVIGDQRSHLRREAVSRARLFQAYVEGNLGALFVRFGRQILAWGETDGFRLLDNINPIDSSFGGFLISLDERRVPLDMLRLSYDLGSFGGILSDLFVEGYVAVDDKVAWDPGIPAGSPWSPPTLGIPNTLLYPIFDAPARSLSDARGGLQVKFNARVPAVADVTVGLAHYYTFLDVPAVRAKLARGPIPGFPGYYPDSDPDGAGYPPDDVDGAGIPDRTVGALAKLELTAAHTQITGISSSFALPSAWGRVPGIAGEPIVRTELAYFHDEPRFRQLDFEPLLILKSPECRAAPVGSDCPSRRRLDDSVNLVVGLDFNQYIRWLNPNQSFLISTQFFYKHLLNPVKRRPIPGYTPRSGIVDGEVAPVPTRFYFPTFEFEMVHTPVDQYFHTLLVATSYRSGQINPALFAVYDWYGGVVVQPQVTFSYDPFRFTLSYSCIEAARWKGSSGVSLLRDRDSAYFQFEYVM